MTKELKWEYKYWFFPERESEIEAAAQHNEDYICQPKGLDRRIMAGPDGLCSPYDNNFWVAHTNFRVEQPKLFETCKNTEGIEYFDQISPYRFRVIIGKLFCGEEVRAAIKNKLCEVKEPQKQYFSLIKSEDGTRRVYGETPEEVLKQIPANAKVIKKSW